MRKGIFGLLVLGALLAAGCRCTAVERTVFTTRPEMEWDHTEGDRYALECYAAESGEIFRESPNYARGSWRPDKDLLFEKDYRVEVQNNETGEHALCSLLKVRFETPALFHPEDGQEQLMSIEPELRWKVADHPWPEARYTVQISERPDFKVIAWKKENIGGPGEEQQFTGVDQVFGTEDDISFVGVQCDQVLSTAREYFWQVRVDYFKGESPIGHGDWSPPRSFFTASQPTGEVIQDVQQITTEATQDRHPDISSDFNLAFEAWTGGDISQIQVKRGKREFNKVIFHAGVEQFSQGDSFDRAPDWDPGGHGIAFSSNRGGSVYRIWYRKTEAGGYQEITSTNKQDANDPDHAPPGGKLAYVSNDPKGNPWIWVVEVDGSKPTRVTEGFQPAWSRDGTRIAFVQRNRAGGRKDALNPSNIFVMDLASGTGPTQITRIGSNLHPSWSPDDERIVFSSNRSGNWDVWEMEAAGGEEPRQLTNYLGTDTEPVYTPDGNSLIFSTTRFQGNFDIALGRIPPR